MIVSFLIWLLSAFFLGWIFGFTPDSTFKEIFSAIIVLVPSVTVAGLTIRYGLKYFSQPTISPAERPNAWFVLAVAIGLAVGGTFGFYAKEHKWFRLDSPQVAKFDSINMDLKTQLNFYTRLTGDSLEAKKILLMKSIGNGDLDMNSNILLWKWDSTQEHTDTLATRIFNSKFPRK